MTKQKLGLIFTGIAIGGTIVTNVITAMRTLKYKEILEECDGNKPKAVAKTYWPSLISGAATIGAITLAEKANLAEIGILTGSCAFLAAKAHGLEDAIADRADEQILEDIRENELVQYIKLPGPSVEETGRGDELCLEAYSGRWFRSSKEAVDRAVEEFQKMHDDGYYLSMNDLYILLGIVETRFGHDYGFPANDEYFEKHIVVDVDYYEGVKEKFGEPVLVIDILTGPIECWQEL